MSDAFDPNAVEGEKASGTQYISPRELKIAGIALVVLSVPMYFVYQVLLGNSERHRCISNLGAVYAAINLYAEQHDNRFPTITRTQGDLVTPDLGTSGNPYSWVSDVAPFMSTRQSFLCPSAEGPEIVHNESADSAKKTVDSAYGIYAPYGGVLTSLVESPDEVILVAETSDNGSKSTFDPKPFGSGIPDGFSIGWSDSNFEPSKTTTSVTRLAFPGSATGTTKRARHGTFIQALSASGRLLQLTPPDAAYQSGGTVNSHWRLPPGYRGPGGH
jgi:hypothetical protein